jgi:hypothetical protein
LLTDAGILRGGEAFTDVRRFEHDGLTICCFTWTV